MAPGRMAAKGATDTSRPNIALSSNLDVAVSVRRTLEAAPVGG